MKSITIKSNISLLVLVFYLISTPFLQAQTLEDIEKIEDYISQKDTLALNETLVGIVRKYDDGEFVLNTVKRLIENGAAVNYRDTTGKTILYHAAGKDQKILPTVKYLLTQGAEVNIVDDEGNTPLLNCVYNLFFYYEEDIVKHLIDAGADLNKVGRGGSLLHVVCNYWSGRDTSELKHINYFIESGADVNLVDNKGRTPLIRAVDRGSVEVARLLMKHGADLSKKDVEGNTAFHYVTSVEMMVLFEEYGGNVNVVNKRGNTLLQELAYWDCSAVSYWRDAEWIREMKVGLVQKLVELGVDVSHINHKGQTAVEIFKLEYKDKEYDAILLELFDGK